VVAAPVSASKVPGLVTDAGDKICDLAGMDRPCLLWFVTYEARAPVLVVICYIGGKGTKAASDAGNH
jgi:hypothetical protein